MFKGWEKETVWCKGLQKDCPKSEMKAHLGRVPERRVQWWNHAWSSRQMRNKIQLPYFKIDKYYIFLASFVVEN